MKTERAIEILNEYDVNFDGIPAEEIADAMELAIEALESQKTSVWLDYASNEHFAIRHRVCLACGEEPEAWSTKKPFRYCPNCGAKMEGVTG